MHEITPQLEQVLRAQGLDDVQIDELRRTGRIQRADDAGNTATVELDASDGAAASHVVLDGAQLTAELHPEALEKLRRFHRFMPAETIDGVERATGQDVDGDGRIGRGPDTLPAQSSRVGDGQVPATVAVTGTGATPDKPVEMLEGVTGARIPTGEHRRSGAMPGSAGGPSFGNEPGSSARSLLPIAVALLVIAMFIYLALR